MNEGESPDLELVEGDGEDRCGAATESGGACQRETDGGRCWQHEKVEGPQPPEHLSEIGADKWRQIATALEEAGKLYAVDAGLLEGAAESYECRRAARQCIANKGLVIEGRSGAEKANPAATRFTEYSREYRQCMKEIKATAQEAPKRDDDSVNELGALLGGDSDADFNPFA